jgi:hypothetical protein
MSKLGLVILLFLLASVTIISCCRIGRHRKNGAASRSATPPGATDSIDSPIAHESIVPGKLTVDVYLHSLESLGGPVPCWTYVSSGLWSLGQKEISFTVKKRPSEADRAYPRDLLQFYHAVYRLADQKRLVDIGGSTTLNPNGAPLLGRKDFCGVLYAPPQALKGVRVTAPWLTALILTTNELTVAHEYGMVRLMTILGSRYRFFPTAPWADRDRPELVSPRDMETSILSRMARAHLYGASVRQENQPISRTELPGPRSKIDQTIKTGLGRVVLRIRPGAAESVRTTVAQARSDTPITLLVGPDPSAPACFSWHAGQKEVSAISKPGATGSHIGGNFIAFVQSKQDEGGYSVEDGFGILLRLESWTRLLSALEHGEPWSIPPREDKMGFALVWTPEVEPDFVDPIESQFPGGWKLFDTPGAEPPGRSKPVVVRDVALLTSEDVISGRIEVDALAAYLKELETVVGSHFATLTAGQGRDLALVFDLRPDGTRDVQLLVRPETNGGVTGGLKDELLQVPQPPSVHGPVRFQLNFFVWGGSAPSPAPALR